MRCIRVIWIGLFLGACQSEGVQPWSPESPWAWEEEDAPRVLMEGVQGATGLAVDELEVLWGVDPGAGLIWRMETDAGAEVVVEELSDPRWIAVSMEQVVVTEGGESGRVMAWSASEGLRILATGGGWGSVKGNNGVFYWHREDSGEVWRWASGEEAVALAGLEETRALAVGSDSVVVAAGSSKPWSLFERSEGAADWVLLGEVWDEPFDMTWGEGHLWLTTRSSRWPFGGWLYRLEGSAAKVHVYSPPEPNRITVSDTHLYWASKQTLTRCGKTESTYESIAVQTAITDVVMWNQAVVWTDVQRGLVLAWSE